MNVLIPILGVLGTVSMISAALIKGNKMKIILFLVFCGNVLSATSYLLGESGINGAASCYLGGVQAIINYFFDSKEKKIPKWLIVIYALSFVCINLLVGDYKDPLVYVAIAATLTFVMCIGQSNGAKYRFWTLFNNALWLLYDILSESWEVLVTVHIPLVIFTVVGMFMHDRKKPLMDKE